MAVLNSEQNSQKDMVSGLHFGWCLIHMNWMVLLTLFGLKPEKSIFSKVAVNIQDRINPHLNQNRIMPCRYPGNLILTNPYVIFHMVSCCLSNSVGNQAQTRLNPQFILVLIEPAMNTLEGKFYGIYFEKSKTIEFLVGQQSCQRPLAPSRVSRLTL